MSSNLVKRLAAIVLPLVGSDARAAAEIEAILAAPDGVQEPAPAAPAPRAPARRAAAPAPAPAAEEVV